MSQVVLITGANRGIGNAFAKAYHAKGWRVLATARNPEAARAHLDFLPEQDILLLDVTSEESIVSLKRTLKDLKLDLLINNAGIYLRDYGQLEEIKTENMMLQFQVNSLAPLLMAQTFLENLDQGSEKLTKIINITSRMGSIEDNTSGGSFGYRASKAALNCITKTLAVNLKNQGKNVATMALHPGYVETDMTHNKGDITAEEAVQKMIIQIEKLTLHQSGCFLHRDGFSLPY